MTADAVGGVWQYATDLSAGLASCGIEVLLAVMGPPPSDDQRASAEARWLRVVEAPFRLEWMDDPWEDVADAAGWLLDLETTFSPDVVHLNGYCHAALPWQSPTIVAAHSCVRSWWRAVHGCAAPSAWDRYSAAVADGLRAAGLVVAPTHAMLEALGREYGAFGQARVIANGRSPIGAATGVEKSEIVFAAGRLWDAAKNIEALCAAAPRVPWPVYVAGPDADTGAGTETVRRLGQLPADAVRDWQARAAIYALPARYEPFGLSILEAATAGCALVLGDIPSLRENWSDAAAFVPPDDVDALVSSIGGLIEDPVRRADLAARALNRASRFSLPRMVSDYVDAYTALASTPSPGVDTTSEGARGRLGVPPGLASQGRREQRK
jgi:glycosyltransferase involved in cell wall biosynthesis